MSRPELIEAMLADREAAWPFRAECFGHLDRNGWMAGKYDHVRVIQAFARHRPSPTHLPDIHEQEEGK